MTMTFDFTTRHVVVTGAAGGIGSVLCRAFVDWGAAVAALDCDRAGLETLAVTLSAGHRLSTHAVDLTDRLATAAVLASATAAAGPVDILINNAGGASATALANLTPEGWQADLDLNLTAAYYCVEAVKESMLARHVGVIINIGSVNSLLALGHPAYSAAKAGLVSYTRSLAIEYGPRGLRANIICPATVKTQAWAARVGRNPAIFEQLKRWYPLRDLPGAGDVAVAAAFLASDEARFINGVVLPVDAGLTAGNPVLAAELTLESF